MRLKSEHEILNPVHIATTPSHFGLSRAGFGLLWIRIGAVIGYIHQFNARSIFVEWGKFLQRNVADVTDGSAALGYRTRAE